MEPLDILRAVLATGSRFALLGVGFGLITSVFGYFSMSYPMLVVLAAFGGYVFSRGLDWPLFAVVPATVLLAMAGSLLHVVTMDRLRRLTRLREPALFMFLATGALFICARNMLLLSLAQAHSMQVSR
ncbi:MAG: hypothetical protein ACLQME_20925 [Alphaproteobacteria bacterium]